MTKTDNPIGEIIEAGTMAFVAQCLEVPRQITPKLYDPPPLGAFVKLCKPQRETPTPPELGAGGRSSLELVSGGEPEEEDPFAPTRSGLGDIASAGTPLPAATYALVYGANTSSLEPNRRPSALGFADEDELRDQQPQIFELLRTEFSGLLIAYAPGDGKALRRHLPPTPPRIHSRVYVCDPAEVRALTEDLSFLRGACEAQHNDQEFLLRAGRTLATLLAEDYDRLQAILRAAISIADLY